MTVTSINRKVSARELRRQLALDAAKLATVARAVEGLIAVCEQHAEELQKLIAWREAQEAACPKP